MTGWDQFGLPLDEAMRSGLKFSTTPAPAATPGFHRATFDLAKPGDTFLDLRPWGKGNVWVNGHHLGRYWNIGPTQTMYIPGVWLKAGRNEVVILDLLGPEKPVVAALEKPILGRLRPQLDFAPVPKTQRVVDAAEPIATGSFPAGSELQEVKFATPAQGRYFALQSLSADHNSPCAAVAELALLGANGEPLSTQTWKIASVDSEETAQEDGLATNAVDGQTASHWVTEYSPAKPPSHPHTLVLDLGRVETITGFRYVPRQGQGPVQGRIKDYRILIGTALKPVAK